MYPRDGWFMDVKLHWKDGQPSASLSKIPGRCGKIGVRWTTPKQSAVIFNFLTVPNYTYALSLARTDLVLCYQKYNIIRVKLTSWACNDKPPRHALSGPSNTIHFNLIIGRSISTNYTSFAIDESPSQMGSCEKLDLPLLFVAILHYQPAFFVVIPY